MSNIDIKNRVGNLLQWVIHDFDPMTTKIKQQKLYLGFHKRYPLPLDAEYTKIMSNYVNKHQAKVGALNLDQETAVKMCADGNNGWLQSRLRVGTVITCHNKWACLYYAEPPSLQDKNGNNLVFILRTVTADLDFLGKEVELDSNFSKFCINLKDTHKSDTLLEDDDDKIIEMYMDTSEVSDVWKRDPRQHICDQDMVSREEVGTYTVISSIDAAIYLYYANPFGKNCVVWYTLWGPLLQCWNKLNVAFARVDDLVQEEANANIVIGSKTQVAEKENQFIETFLPEKEKQFIETFLIQFKNRNKFNQNHMTNMLSTTQKILHMIQQQQQERLDNQKVAHDLIEMLRKKHG